ncbi:nuclear membrane fusion protein Kar5, putative [Trichophyton verrucosum HKI 0517]|uniref:Nuclear membrane fusion protein Kar5, putative n=1 Tax=Trichophyton verrucosum (strain HKI 0517) TaxID=663202 RepID=D4DB99_TRIVH|nr:nuclear membrane fusion protein Kar5, putative [Trichophyton verrucosum HKI 0517]EFE40933.1 nuclear membrane fusion protein Kar5, putative [Trichophyton verrucosum HKI 0517]
MAYSASYPRVVRIISLFFYLHILTSTIGSVTGFKLPSFLNSQAPAGLRFRDIDKVPDDDSQISIDLPLLLHKNPAQGNIFFSKALHLLDSMQHAPSCNQRAVASLITSCQALSPETSERRHYTHFNLDHVKSLYAARLAVCEITGTGAAIPEKCLDTFPSHNSWRPQYKDSSQGFQVADEERSIPAAVLEPCLRSLESKPQWWTSYSNGRQNAAVMCHAARFEIEKEELLNHHRSLTEVTHGLNMHLNRSLEDSYTQAQQHREFIRSIDTLRQNLLRDLRRDNNNIQNQVTELLSGTRDMFRNANGEFRGFIETTLTETATLAKQIKSSIISAQEVKRVLNEVLVKEVKRNSDLVSAEQTALQANARLITNIQGSLTEVKQAGMGIIVEELKHLHMSMRVNHIDAALSHFEEKAAFLQNVMTTQILNQTRLQQSFHEDLRAAQTLLHNITNSAIYLQATIGDAQSTFSTLIPWKGSLISIIWWLWYATLFGILTLFKTKLIIYAIFFSVFGAVLFILGCHDWFQTIQTPTLITLRQVTPVEIICFALVFVISSLTIVTIAVKGFPFKSKLGMNTNSETLRLP